MNLSLLIAGLCVAQTLLSAHGVGEVSFANTGAAAAQPAFLRGLALLHDFEYGSAAESFPRGAEDRSRHS